MLTGGYLPSGSSSLLHSIPKSTTEQYKSEILAYLALKNPSFEEGFALFSRFNNRLSIAAYLSRKRSLSKLLYELKKISERPVIKLSRYNTSHHPAIVKHLVKDSPAPPAIPLGIVLEYVSPPADQESKDELEKLTGSRLLETLPSELQPVYQRARKYYHAMYALHTALKVATSDKERAEIYAKLKTAENNKDKCWSQINEWKKSKDVPEAPSISKASDSGKDTARAILNAKTYLTKGLKKISKYKDEELEEFKLKLKSRADFLLSENVDLGKYENPLKEYGII